jgi:hypothetical protein
MCSYVALDFYGVRSFRMSHPMQNALRTNTSQLPVYVKNEEPLALADTLKIVFCPICRAVYIPSWQQEREQTSLAMLESTFLAICHFCFRCRRPACPQCWNPIHCVCTSCSEEAHLPFRSPVPPLEGLIFSCPLEGPSIQQGPRSFTCLRNGSFLLPAGAPGADVSPGEQGVLSAPTTPGELPVLQDNADLSVPGDQSRAQEAMGRGREEQAGEPGSGFLGQRIQSAALWPPLQAEPQGVFPHTSTGGHERVQGSRVPPLHPEAQVPFDPPWVQEMMSRGREEQVSRPVSCPVGQWPQSTALWPQVQAESQSSLSHPNAGGPEWAQVSRLLPSQPAVPVPPVGTRGGGTQELGVGQGEDEEIPLFERVENVLIIVIAALLLAIVLMVILALSSAQMDAFFYQLIHIDIRTEILYLLQVR